MIEILEGLPDDSSYDEIVQELVFNRMVERGLADADAGLAVDLELHRVPRRDAGPHERYRLDVEVYARDGTVLGDTVLGGGRIVATECPKETK